MKKRGIKGLILDLLQFALVLGVVGGLFYLVFYRSQLWWLGESRPVLEESFEPIGNEGGNLALPILVTVVAIIVVGAVVRSSIVRKKFNQRDSDKSQTNKDL